MAARLGGFSILLVTAVAIASGTPATLPSSPCPAGFTAIGDDGTGYDCVQLPSTSSSPGFVGNYSEAQAHCRSLLASDSSSTSGGVGHLVFLRDSAFTRLLGAALLAVANVNNNSVSYWLAAERQSSAPGASNSSIVWLNGTYRDETYAPLPTDSAPAALNDSANGTTGDVGYGQLLGDGRLVVRFSQPTALRTALCARQLSPNSPALPAETKPDYSTASHWCPADAQWYFAGACYRFTSGANYATAAAACRAWKTADGSAPAVVNDWRTQQLATVLADEALRSSNTSLVHIGLTLPEPAAASGWGWDARPDTPVRVTVWAEGEPLSGGSSIHHGCAAVASATGLWFSRPCDQPVSALLCQAPCASAAKKLPAAAILAADISVVATKTCRPGFFHFDASCYRLQKPCSQQPPGPNVSTLWVTQPAQLAFASLLASQLEDYASAQYQLAWPVPFDAAWQRLPKQLPPSYSFINTTVNSTAPAGAFVLGFSGVTGALTTEVARDDLRPACRYDLPTVTPTEVSKAPSKPTAVTCPSGWTLDSDDRHCLATTPPDKVVAWFDAEAACGRLGGKFSRLASLHTALVPDVAKALLPKASDTGGVWIGLKVRRTSGGLMLRPAWTDASPFDFLPPTATAIDALSPLTHQPSLQCGYATAVDDSSGGVGVDWRLTTNCAGAPNRTALCQLLTPMPTISTTISTTTISTTTNSPSPMTTTTTTTAPLPTPQTAASFNASCLAKPGQRLSADGNRCYAYAVLASPPLLNWSQAAAACRERMGPKGHLATVQSVAENQFVARLATETLASQAAAAGYALAWIGLRDELGLMPDQLTVWSDGTPVQFVNFANDEADDEGGYDPAARSCTAIAFKPSSHPRGLWHPRDCTKTLPAICKATVGELAASTSTSPTAAGASTKRVCPAGWDTYYSSIGSPPACYRLSPTPTTYEAARRECQRLGGDLASYQTSGQHEFAVSRLAGLDGRRSGMAWIGLQYEPTIGHYRWLDGTPLEHLDWPRGASSYAAASVSCIGLRYHPLLAASGYQVAAACRLEWPALCRRAPVLPAAPTKARDEPDAGCPAGGGYSAFNGSCYLLVDGDMGRLQRSYSDAEAACRVDGASLLWLESAFEVHYLRSLAAALSNPPTLEVWLGLRSTTESITSLNWTNGQPLRFDYLLPESHHYQLDHMTGCFVYHLYQRPTPAVRGLSRIRNHGLAQSCDQRKAYVCKKKQQQQHLPTVSAAPDDNNPVDCFEHSAARPYAGRASYSSQGEPGGAMPCVRWDLVRALYEQGNGRNFANHTDLLAALSLLPTASLASSRGLSLLPETFDDTVDGQETLGEAASYCRQLGRLAKGASVPAGIGDRPVCFVRLSASSAGQPDNLSLRYCDVPRCDTIGDGHSGQSDDSGSSHHRSVASVGALAAIVVACACAVAGVGVLGFCLWKRGRWAAGYRPQLNLDGGGGAGVGVAMGGGGTSFHNPIYMPANC